MRLFRLVMTLLVGLVGFSFRPPASASAAGVVGNGMAESCSEVALDVALAGGGMVTFDCGTDPVTITITSTKTIAADATIDGGSLITISGGDSVGIFSVNAGVNFTVQNLSIANGHSAKGGGISNFGTLTVRNVTFSGNSAPQGAGITNSGTLSVTNSTFSGNSASGYRSYGGAILNVGTLTVTNSTFSDNSASSPPGEMSQSEGGGIANYGTLTITNSTFARNSAVVYGYGGGIFSEGGTIVVTNSTFSEHSAGGAILVFGTLTVTNSIFSGSSGRNCRGKFVLTDGGHNIDDGTSCGFSPTDGSLSNTDPKLDPAGLADNGGPTQTIGLQAGSPAINAGDESVCAAAPVNNFDQRGYTRPGVGSANCSIGAYEFNSLGPTAACIGDCLGDKRVTIDDILTMVNIALGTAPLSECDSGNVDGDQEITIDEILMAVNFALTACPLTPAEQGCVNSGGAVTTAMCCASTGDFPDTCGIGACSCPPDASHEVRTCDCGAGRCFGGSACASR